MAAELRSLDAAGEYDEILPDWSNLTFSQDLYNAGSLVFSYPLSGRNVSRLAQGNQVAILIDGQEPINGRFSLVQAEGSRIAEDEGGLSRWQGESTLGLFRRMMLAPSSTSTFADETSTIYIYTAKSPGYIVTDVMTNARSRAVPKNANPHPWVTFPFTSFSNTLDSSGAAWTNYDATFAPGFTVADVFEWLTTNNLAEPHMYKKELRLYRPETNGTDRSDTIVLQTGRDFTEASYEADSSNLVNAVLVIGDKATGQTYPSCKWVFDQTSINTYGYREGVYRVNSVSSTTLLTDIGTRFLEIYAYPRMSYTYAVSALYLDQPGTAKRPFIDYRVGDDILILDGETRVQRLRLLSATWPNSRAASVALTVNDFIAEKLEQFERRIAALEMST